MADIDEENRPVPVRKDGCLCLEEGDLSIKGDYTQMLPRLKYNNLSGELLVKAVRRKKKEASDETSGTSGLHILDATAGLGEDSLLLAAAGHSVTLYEYDPVIGALLEDTMLRASQDERLKDIMERMELRKENSIEAMRQMATDPEAERYDVILLDPMFPGRKKSGMIKKKFQLIQQLEKPCEEEAELFDAALGMKPEKIVVKRPLKGPFLAGRTPGYSLTGKAIRVDVYVYPENMN